MCRVLDVSPGGYYDWRGSPPSPRAQRLGPLVDAIRAIHRDVKARYGSPRMHAELVATGKPCSRKTVAKLMRRHGIAAKTRRKFRCTTDSNHDRPVAENILNRRFEPTVVDQAWTADITYVWTAEGWLYLAAVEDLHSRKIVGWSMGTRIDSRLVVDALEMAISRRSPGERPGSPFRPGEPVCQRPLPEAAGQPWDHLQHEPAGELLGQRADGDLLRQPEEGVNPRREVRHEGGGEGQYLRIHRGVLQPRPAAFVAGLQVPDRVRESRIDP